MHFDLSQLLTSTLNSVVLTFYPQQTFLTKLTSIPIAKFVFLKVSLRYQILTKSILLPYLAGVYLQYDMLILGGFCAHFKFCLYETAQFGTVVCRKSAQQTLLMLWSLMSMQGRSQHNMMIWNFCQMM